jgi:hypothetical protein
MGSLWKKRRNRENTDTELNFLEKMNRNIRGMMEWKRQRSKANEEEQESGGRNKPLGIQPQMTAEKKETHQPQMTPEQKEKHRIQRLTDEQKEKHRRQMTPEQKEKHKIQRPSNDQDDQNKGIKF